MWFLALIAMLFGLFMLWTVYADRDAVKNDGWLTPWQFFFLTVAMCCGSAATVAVGAVTFFKAVF